ncbi:TD and POZ domain-containing protein 4 [Parasteatoda tepidariorum]|uniref:TD and POZ domain-containing protein 4 n=1 Tax=Parasteatoda tepidariorum TaxID=114398 RepID=UPI001C725BAA|nr:TD and POZ domain-containing protein 4 [Parasteatoda tepidariorum]
MSPATKITLPVDEVISTEFQPEKCLTLKLGYALNDLWSLRLFKKSLNNGKHFIVLSIERQRDEQRVQVIMKLSFTDLHSNKTLSAQCFKRLRSIDKSKRLNLNKPINRMLYKSEKFRVTGKIYLRLISKPVSLASPQTLITLSTDFRKMCCNTIYSDVNLRCGSEVFAAHKIVLAMRCPKFNEIFKENVNEETIDVKDLTPHVLKAVLLFIYSGVPDPFTFQSACDLLIAADKYGLIELKVLCVNHIRSSFTVKNVLDYFLKYEMAKTYASEFIEENISEIEKTEQWQNFKTEFPDLVSEILQDSFQMFDIENDEQLIEVGQVTKVSSCNDQAPDESVQS